MAQHLLSHCGELWHACSIFKLSASRGVSLGIHPSVLSAKNGPHVFDYYPSTVLVMQHWELQSALAAQGCPSSVPAEVKLMFASNSKTIAAFIFV